MKSNNNIYINRIILLSVHFKYWTSLLLFSLMMLVVLVDDTYNNPIKIQLEKSTQYVEAGYSEPLKIIKP